MRTFFLIFLFYYSHSHANQLDKVLSRNKIDKNDISYILLDLKTSKIIDSYQDKKSMILASVSKIFTMYYALNNVDADFRFNTKLYHTGIIKNKKLEGDLYLVGSGAPFLTANNLTTFINKLKSLNIDMITGKFYVVDSVFENIKTLSELGLEDQADNPSLSGLNVEFNRFQVFKGTRAIPSLENIKISKTKSSINGEKFSFIEQGQNEIWKYNSLENVKNIEELPVKYSSLYAGQLFRHLAFLNQITINYPEVGLLPKDANLIFELNGNTLSQLASLGMEYSNNLIAESILLKATSSKNIKEAASIMFNWYKKKFNQLNWDKANFENGSGLTVNNKVNAHTLAKFLKEVENKIFKNASFQSLFSINALNGGVRNRLKDPEMAYRINAKTGSLYYVNNIAGFISTKSNKKYAFVIMITDDNKRTILNKKNDNKLIKNSVLWYNRAINVQDFLLKEWIYKF